jgi:RHS repeat-associated protein
VARSAATGNDVYVQAGQQTITDYTRGAAPSSPSYRYAYGSYIDEPILRHAGTLGTLPINGTDLLYYHRNQQYSIIAITDFVGNVIERLGYDAYGRSRVTDAGGGVLTDSAFANRISYTGREWDSALAIYHFRARWFEPIAGKFLTRDPFGYVDGMGLTAAYFGLKTRDPYGKSVSNAEAIERIIIKGLFSQLKRKKTTRFKELFSEGPAPLSKEDCAREILNYLWNDGVLRAFGETIGEIAWGLGDILLMPANFWYQFGYAVIRAAAEAIAKGDLDPDELRQLILSLVKEMLSRHGIEVADDVDLSGLVNWIIDTANELTPSNNSVFREVSYGLEHELGNVRCSMIVAGSNEEFETFRVVGSCHLRCDRPKAETLETCACPCGDQLDFALKASGRFGDSYFGHSLEFDDLSAAITILKNNGRRGP